MKYDVTIARYGFVTVDAKSESEAMDIANQLDEEDIDWSDSWEPTDAAESDEYNCLENDTEILKLSEDGKTLLACNKKASGEIVIPEGVTTIGESAF